MSIGIFLSILSANPMVFRSTHGGQAPGFSHQNDAGPHWEPASFRRARLVAGRLPAPAGQHQSWW